MSPSFFVKAILRILRKKESVVDPGTFASNAVLTGKTNAMKDVESENYNKIREFFAIETNAFLLSATMVYFGMGTVNSMPSKNIFPSKLMKASVIEKRKWLYGHVDKLFNLYVAGSVTELSDAQKDMGKLKSDEVILPCRSLGCLRVFRYSKCRVNHEKSCHNLNCDLATDIATDMTDHVKSGDHIFNYGCLHITLGLLIRDAEDAVKEGDGERVVRVWKFFTPLFRLTQCHKYALAGLRLMASIEGLLTPRKAHQLMWNRFAGVNEGTGKRISRDERLEQLNKVAKEEIRSLGFPNINDDNVVKATLSTGSVDKLINQSHADLQRKARGGHHCNKNAKKTLNYFESGSQQGKGFSSTEW